jgi:hypothetical protein
MSVWVMRVLARTQARKAGRSWPKHTPSKAQRMAGPFPAEATPSTLGHKYKTQCRSSARKVAQPIPAGKPSNHQRKRRVKSARNTVNMVAEDEWAGV